MDLKKMKAFQVLKVVFEGRTQELMATLGASRTYVTKWQAPVKNGSGKPNPLWRVFTIMRCVFEVEPERAMLILHWLAAQFNCVVVSLPAVDVCVDDSEAVSKYVADWMKDSGETLTAMGVALESRNSKTIDLVVQELADDYGKGWALVEALKKRT